MMRPADGWLPVRRGEWLLVTMTGTFAFLAVALAIVLRTWSDAVFLSTFDVRFVPRLFVATAFILVPATFGYAWLARRLGSVWLDTLLLGVFGVATLACAHFADEPAGVFAAVLWAASWRPCMGTRHWSGFRPGSGP